MHILIIEDHVKLAENIQKYLETERYAVSVSHDGNEGLEKALTLSIDLLILDINLPGLDGLKICKILRSQGKNMPILMLTAKDTAQETVHGLDAGADDYVKKPFDLDELLARVRSLLRRKSDSKEPILVSGSIKLDTNTHDVWKGDTKISLSPKEYGLLEFLLRTKGSVQDRPSILEHVWGRREDLLLSQTVDVHIAYLRRKIGKNVIHTIPGKGYMIPSA